MKSQRSYGFLITKELIFWLPNFGFFFTFQPPKTGLAGGGARGKFVGSAKVLAAVPSISQPRRVYEDRPETGGAGKELSTNNEIQSSGRVVFWNGE